MRFVSKIVLFIVLVNNSACSQNFPEKIAGEWLLKTNYEAPDLIIFRSDNKYFVYNDMDFMGTPNNTKPYEIVFDNKAVTAMTETGEWHYHQSMNQIILTNRNFIKKASEFNSYYGKEGKLVFKVKSLKNNELIICSEIKENSCDTYIRNANLTGDNNITFYQEITDNYTGTGSQKKEILLSGYETELKLSYDFYKEADQLTVTDKNGKELFSTKMESTNERIEKEISIRGVTNLIFRINSSKPNSKWELELDIK